MKKMNKKGFAITALLYGLSIMGFMCVVLMMSIMQHNRKNTTTLVKSIEHQLNTYGLSSVKYDTVGASTFTVPSKQSGYYKIEVWEKSGGDIASGTIYLDEGKTLNINLLETTTTISIDGNTIMTVKGTGGNTMIKGSSRNHSSNDTSKPYYFIHSKAIVGGSNETKPKYIINKVSTALPEPMSTAFNNVKCIQSSYANKIYITYFDPSNPKTFYKEEKNATTGNKFPSIPTTANKQILEITAEASTNPTLAANGASLSFFTDNNCTSGESKISANKSGFSVTKASGTYTYSRYSPLGDIKTGNYLISLADKSGTAWRTSAGQTLTTTSYKPANAGAASTAAGTGEHLIKYGSSSFARPVKIIKYTGGNNQKWRIEVDKECNHPPGATNPKKSKITDIEQYKPFEVHKQDESQEKSGPQLVCGVFTYEGTKFKSTDTYTGNVNQEWDVLPAGDGFYVLKTNHRVMNGISEVTPGVATYSNELDRYLYYDGGKFYVTSDTSKASLFELINVDL